MKDKVVIVVKWITIFCFFGFIITLLAYYPGFMSPDSFDQYGQSLTHHFSDWHPPAMAFLWSVFDYLYQGPQLMLIFQLALYWLSCYILASSIANRVWQVLIIVSFFLAPFFQNFAGYIIKDTQMTFSWLVVVTILLRCSIAKRPITKFETIISVLLLTYGTWVRHNSISGLLPVCFLWAMIVFANKNNKHKLVSSLFLFLAIVAGQKLFNLMLKSEKRHPEHILYMHDMSGVFVRTGKDVFPSEMYKYPGFDTTYLRQKYHPGSYDHIWWNVDNKTFTPNDSLNGQLKSSWFKAIEKHPIAYLKNRWDGFLYVLRIKKRSEDFSNYYFVIYPSPNKYGITINDANPLYRMYSTMVDVQKNLPYLQPWFWVILNILLFAWIPKIKEPSFKVAFIMLILSSLLYWLPAFFLLTTDTDFRYFYWNCISCSLAIFILIAYKIKQKSVRSDS